MGWVRITSGRLKGRKVTTPAGAATRPLLTRLRKSLADILRPRLPGAGVLDLYGGSGAIVFELISNGAARAVVVEIHRRTAELIRRTAGELGLGAAVIVHHGDALEAVEALAGRGQKFDIIIIAPPYNRGLQPKTLDSLADGRLLLPGGVIVVQREEREPELEAPAGLCRVQRRCYGRTVFELYQRAGNGRDART